MDLIPGTNASLSTALKVRTFTFTRAVIDDGDTWYVVVTHRKMPWAQPENQTYALAVSLEELEETEIDLYSLVQQQIRVRERIRVRPRV